MIRDLRHDDTPIMQSSNYVSRAYGGANSWGIAADDEAADFVGQATQGVLRQMGLAAAGVAGVGAAAPFQAFQSQTQEQDQTMANVNKKRLVRVVLVDPNDNIPINRQVLYKGDETYTDQTDEELRYELNLKEILAKHNEYRVTVIDKTVKERTQHLEPARLRDLVFNVIIAAIF